MVGPASHDVRAGGPDSTRSGRALRSRRGLALGVGAVAAALTLAACGGGGSSGGGGSAGSSTKATLTFAPDASKRVAPVAIAQFAGEHGVDFGATFAGAVVTALVPLLVLLFFQRYFTQSVTQTGVKG